MTDDGDARSRDLRGIDDRGGGGGGGDRSGPTRDFALIIGIDHYPLFRSLKGAVNDAQRFLDWLIHEDGGGVAPSDVRFVPSREEPPTPLQKQIDDALSSLVHAAEAAGGGRRLYFHFSGHGAEIAVHDIGLLLAQWSPTLGGPALSSRQYQDHLIGMRRFHEIVVVLDCCRRTGKPVLGLGPGFTIDPDHQTTTHFVAYATESSHRAFERPDSDGEWHGVLTRCLLDILHGERGIPASRLQKVLFGTLQAAGQRPEIVNGLPPDSPFGPTGPLPVLEIRFERPIGRAQLIEYRDGQPVVAAETTVGDDLVWRQRLANGIYKLVAGDRTKLIAHEARIERAGGRQDAVTRETF